MTDSSLVNQGWNKIYLTTWAFYLAMILLVLGGLNTLGMSFFSTDPLRILFGDGILVRVLYGAMGLSAIGVMTNRDTYLPFLGPTVAPCASFPNREPPHANRSVRVTVEPRAKVLYWASEPANEKIKDVPSWKEAYQKYENAGIATADENGVAILRVRTPQAYQVPFRGLLEPHVHYRVCEEAGWMGRVRTIPVDGAPSVEAFSDHLDKENFQPV